MAKKKPKRRRFKRLTGWVVGILFTKIVLFLTLPHMSLSNKPRCESASCAVAGFVVHYYQLGNLRWIELQLTHDDRYRSKIWVYVGQHYEVGDTLQLDVRSHTLYERDDRGLVFYSVVANEWMAQQKAADDK